MAGKPRGVFFIEYMYSSTAPKTDSSFSWILVTDKRETGAAACHVRRKWFIEDGGTSRAIHTTINNMLRIWSHNSIRIIKLLYLNILFALNYFASSFKLAWEVSSSIVSQGWDYPELFPHSPQLLLQTNGGFLPRNVAVAIYCNLFCNLSLIRSNHSKLYGLPYRQSR